MGSAAVIGDEGAWWSAVERVEEHAEGEREQSLCDSLDETARCLREVLLESHLAFLVRDRRLDHEPQTREMLLAGEVVGAADAAVVSSRTGSYSFSLAATIV